jgi:hypothetical protein
MKRKPANTEDSEIGIVENVVRCRIAATQAIAAPYIANETPYTTAAPATYTKPPSAGPPITASCITDDDSAVARGSSLNGTRPGSKACCAGACNARATPSTTLVARMSSRCTAPLALAHASNPATMACSTRLAASTARRSTRSASWPAGIVSSSAGRNCIRPTSPRSHALDVRSYICQPSATSIIWFAAEPSSRTHRK